MNFGELQAMAQHARLGIQSSSGPGKGQYRAPTVQAQPDRVPGARSWHVGARLGQCRGPGSDLSAQRQCGAQFS